MNREPPIFPKPAGPRPAPPPPPPTGAPPLSAAAVEAWFPAQRVPNPFDDQSPWECACGVAAGHGVIERAFGDSPGDLFGPTDMGMDGYQRHMEWHAAKITAAVRGPA